MELQADNPYRAPSAPIQPVRVDPADVIPVLYAVPAWKFLLLSIGSFGVFLIVWFYRNWVAIRRARQVKLSPVARAIFSGLTAYFCFEQMEDVMAKRLGRRTPDLSGGSMAFLYFLLGATSRMDDPFWMISLLAPLPVLWINQQVRAANALGEEPVAVDAPLSWSAWVLMAFGFCLFALVLLGALAGMLAAE